MAYKAAAIANYFIRKAGKKHELTPMKLQKLVYIAHGWYLAIYDEPLIEELVEAWKFGPVIQSLYYELRKYGADPVTEEIKDVVFVDGTYKFEAVPVPTDENVTELLDAVWKNYSRYSAFELSNLTHQIGTPWYKVYNNKNKTEKTAIIEDQAIRKHFIELYDRIKARAK